MPKHGGARAGTGRPNKWEIGNPKVLLHVGAPSKEPADEYGLVKPEHDLNVHAATTFEQFALPGASKQDKDVKNIGMSLVAKQRALGRDRLESQLKLAAALEIKTKYKRESVPPVEEPHTGTFFQNVFYDAGCSTKPLATEILAMLTKGAKHESTAAQPFDPAVGQIVAGPEDKMRVFDAGVAHLRHHVAEKVFA